MAERRFGKPYIYVTWLAKQLGGHQCRWSAWFKAHFKYDKYEEMAGDLHRWNADHTRMMARRRQELEADGWTIFTEQQNAFKLDLPQAVVAGKGDIVAVKGTRALIVDGKTGRERDSDIWQLLIYLRTYPRVRPALAAGEWEGEVLYKNGPPISLTASELTEERLGQITDLIRVIASEEPPPRTPSRDECRMCNIGPADCPQRVMADADAVAVGEF